MKYDEHQSLLLGHQRTRFILAFLKLRMRKRELHPIHSNGSSPLKETSSGPLCNAGSETAIEKKALPPPFESSESLETKQAQPSLLQGNGGILFHCNTYHTDPLSNVDH